MAAEDAVRTAARRSSDHSELPADPLTQHGWRFADDPPSETSHIDRLAVGPGGIFLIHRVDWTGRISCDDSVLRQNGLQRELVVARCADAAITVASLLPTELVRHVHPVLCFARDEPLSGWARDVKLCSTATLEQFLLTRPPVLPPERVALVFAQVLAAISVPEEPSVAPAQAILTRLAVVVVACIGVIAAGASVPHQTPLPQNTPSSAERGADRKSAHDALP